jgi:capsular exopolysaccharide synthesis family protein
MIDMNENQKSDSEAHLAVQKSVVNHPNQIIVKNYINNHTLNNADSDIFKTLGLKIINNLVWIFLFIFVLIISGFYLFSLTPQIYSAKASFELSRPILNVNYDAFSTFPNNEVKNVNNIENQLLKNEIVVELEKNTHDKQIEKLVSPGKYYFINNIYVFLKNKYLARNISDVLANQASRKEKLINAVHVYQKNNGKTFEIITYALHPKVAVDVANLAIFSAFELMNNIQIDGEKKDLPFYEEKLAIAKERHDVANNEKNTFVVSNHYLLPEQREIKHQELMATLQIFEKRVSDFTRIVKDPSKIKTTKLNSLSSQKTLLSQEYQRKLVDLKPKHPEMLEISSSINELDQNILYEKNQYLDEMRRKSLDDIASLNEAKELLRQFELRILNDQALDDDYNNLALKFDKTKLIYENLLRFCNALKSTDDTVANLVKIDYSSSPFAVLNKTFFETYLILGIASLLFITAFIFSSIYRTRIYRSKDDIELDFSIPVIASIPKTNIFRNRLSFHQNFISKSDEVFTEAIRKAATALYFSDDRHMPCIIGVTSANESEGKTVTSCSLAKEYSSLGHKVLLVDLNFRNPTLHENFKLDGSRGLTNVLVLNESPVNVTHQTSFLNLHVIPAGPSPANQTKLLSSNKFREFIEMAKLEFDVIIFDCPAINKFDEMLLIGNDLDNLVVCTNINETKKVSIKKAIKKMLSVSCLPTGFILTFQPRTNFVISIFRKKVNYKNLLAGPFKFNS